MNCTICLKEILNDDFKIMDYGPVHNTCRLIVDKQKQSIEAVTTKTITAMLKQNGQVLTEFGGIDWDFVDHFYGEESRLIRYSELTNGSHPKKCDWKEITDINLDAYFYRFESTYEDSSRYGCVKAKGTCQCGRYKDQTLTMKVSITDVLNQAIKLGYVNIN